jgi:hypothetical protein
MLVLPGGQRDPRSLPQHRRSAALWPTRFPTSSLSDGGRRAAADNGPGGGGRRFEFLSPRARILTVIAAGTSRAALRFAAQSCGASVRSCVTAGADHCAGATAFSASARVPTRAARSGSARGAATTRAANERQPESRREGHRLHHVGGVLAPMRGDCSNPPSAATRPGPRRGGSRSPTSCAGRLPRGNSCSAPSRSAARRASCGCGSGCRGSPRWASVPDC